MNTDTHTDRSTDTCLVKKSALLDLNLKIIDKTSQGGVKGMEKNTDCKMKVVVEDEVEREREVEIEENHGEMKELSAPWRESWIKILKYDILNPRT